MPSKKDFSNSKIYKIEPIVDHIKGDIYIGSTTKPYLSSRMAAHRCCYRQRKEGKPVSHFTVHGLFDKYGVENCKISLLEKFPCKTQDELFVKESEYIKKFQCVNQSIPSSNAEKYKR